MKKLLIAAAVAATLGLSASAFAMGAQSGVYVGAQGLATTLSTPDAYILGTGTGTAFSRKDFGYGWGLDLGYDYAYSTHTSFGLEVGYDSTSNVAKFETLASSLKFKQTAWDVMATAKYVTDSGFNLFGKAGMARVSQKVTATNYTAIPSATWKQYRPKVEVGVGYMPMDNLNIFLSYDHIFGQSYSTWASAAGKTKIISSDALALGFTYTFPM